MGENSAEAQAERRGASFDLAVVAAEDWGRGNGSLTGMWVNRRHRTIGVGITEGDEFEATAALRALVPAGIKIRARVASPRLAELWQLQADVHVYLEEAGIWDQWGASLGVNERRELLSVGLAPGTPEQVLDQITRRFPTPDLAVTTANRAIAL